MRPATRNAILLTVAAIIVAIIAWSRWAPRGATTTTAQQTEPNAQESVPQPTTSTTTSTVSAVMIPYNEFGRLRLSAFVPAADIAQLDGWEFQGHLWVGEARGFSEWLRLRDDPQVLRSLAIDLSDFPTEAADAVLRKLRLPIRRGMTAAELDRLLGPRVSEQQLVADRKIYDYFTAAPNRYRISCTVQNAGGLTYVVIMVPPIGDGGQPVEGAAGGE